MVRLGILGATSYTALELIKILLRHPEAEISVMTSRQKDAPHVAAVHPQLIGRLDMRLEDIGPAEVAGRADCVFSCLPDTLSAPPIMQLLDAGARVVDFSADYRLKDPETYLQWYGARHPDPGRLGRASYGMPELFADDIAGAQLVAMPGCSAVAAVLALAPLLKRGMIEPEDIIVDIKSGVSEAGRSPRLTTHFPECNESVFAYDVGRHRHTPEVDQVLTAAAGKDVQAALTTHFVPMDRGLLSTTYARAAGGVGEQELLEALREFHADKPFVRIVDHLPATKDTMGANFCDITVRGVRSRVAIIGCLDNLIKGAAGAAVQNFNLMYGLPETTAL
jgi:N-acetyl-gamma-glutamyl-phosphate reductase